MQWPNELQAQVLTRCLSGAAKGGAVGAAASLATGAAVIVTTPAWLPLIGGSAVVALGTVGSWAAAGSVLGAVGSGLRGWQRYKREMAAFEQAFPPTTSTTNTTQLKENRSNEQ